MVTRVRLDITEWPPVEHKGSGSHLGLPTNLHEVLGPLGWGHNVTLWWSLMVLYLPLLWCSFTFKCLVTMVISCHNPGLLTYNTPRWQARNTIQDNYHTVINVSRWKHWSKHHSNVILLYFYVHWHSFHYIPFFIYLTMGTQHKNGHPSISRSYTNTVQALGTQATMVPLCVKASKIQPLTLTYSFFARPLPR